MNIFLGNGMKDDAKEITIDGQQVQEVTIDGQIVWKKALRSYFYFDNDNWTIDIDFEAGSYIYDNDYLQAYNFPRESDYSYGEERSSYIVLNDSEGSFNLIDVSGYNYMAVDWEGYGDGNNLQYGFGLDDNGSRGTKDSNFNHHTLVHTFYTSHFSRTRDVLNISSLNGSYGIILGFINSDANLETYPNNEDFMRIYSVIFY